MLRDIQTNPDQEQELRLTITGIGDVEYNKKGTPLQKVTLSDGETTTKATIYQGKSQLIPQSANGQALTFKLKGWRSTHNNQVYVQGFWQNQQQQAPQQPQQAPGQQNLSGRVEYNRGIALLAAATSLQGTFNTDQQATDSEDTIMAYVSRAAEFYARYIETGIVQADEPEPEPDDFPG